jgi:hypothetical protein
MAASELNTKQTQYFLGSALPQQLTAVLTNEATDAKTFRQLFEVFIIAAITQELGSRRRSISLTKSVIEDVIATRSRHTHADEKTDIFVEIRQIAETAFAKIFSHEDVSNTHVLNDDERRQFTREMFLEAATRFDGEMYDGNDLPPKIDRIRIAYDIGRFAEYLRFEPAITKEMLSDKIEKALLGESTIKSGKLTYSYIESIVMKAYDQALQYEGPKKERS